MTFEIQEHKNENGEVGFSLVFLNVSEATKEYICRRVIEIMRAEFTTPQSKITVDTKGHGGMSQ